MKTAIIYQYFEVDQTYKENFIYFLNTAIVDDVDYFVYISGNCSFELPEFSNVTYFFIENHNNDFGAVLEFYKQNTDNHYDAYVFINSSVRGPFLPTYNDKNWHQTFTTKLSADVALIGSSINLLPEQSYHSQKFGERHTYSPPFFHVQTMAYALSSEGYQLLAQKGFYDVPDQLEKDDIINDYEIQMSQIIMENGYSISSLLPTFDRYNIDHKETVSPNTLRSGDPLFKSAFFGRSISPLECVFIKTNRNMITERELCSYTYTALLSQCRKGELDVNGIELLNKTSARMMENDQVPITIEQLLAVLTKIKKSNPELRDKIREFLDQ
ncbi:hypothetical protein [Pseudemcibacter aquimaris]|uniref:hypothetical protein n=1 Tax=Pseudemcibacter aquimaris TaxID=2857064 RepID=UPI00201291DF|nr:hypothetical protein [Pseudemcibacter aquimaris]MCC3861104.1 hypothetical protein [Pseudemcibacter aquimaris]WDU59922.1 hypothetical protein KW060_06590 [Pseudemcibacter aquimaris]